ncbi:MFS transporter [Arcanobacterium phocae]|nr:MFS transporter [Arcanobacterium phocae]
MLIGNRGGAQSTLRRIVFVSGLLMFFDFLFGAVYVVAVLRKDVSPAQLGFLFGLSTLFSILIEAPSGNLADRFGHKRFLMTGLAMWGLSLVFLSLSSSIIYIAISLILWTTGMALQSGVFAPILLSSSKTLDRQDLFEKLARQTSNTRWVMSAVGALLIWAFVARIDANTLIMVAGVGIIVLAGLSFFLFQETESTSIASTKLGLKFIVRWLFSDEIRPLVLANVLLGAVTVAIVLPWQPILTLGSDNVGRNGFMLFFMSLAGSYSTKFLLCKFPYSPTFFIGITLISIGLLCVVAMPVAKIVGFLIAECGFGISGVALGALQQGKFSDEHRNGMFSILSTVTLISSTTMNMVFGWLWGRLSIFSAVAISAVTIFILGLLFFLMGKGVMKNSNEKI